MATSLLRTYFAAVALLVSALLLQSAPTAAQNPAMEAARAAQERSMMGGHAPTAGPPDYEPNAQDRAWELHRSMTEGPLRSRGDDRQKKLLEDIAKLGRDRPSESANTPEEPPTKGQAPVPAVVPPSPRPSSKAPDKTEPPRSVATTVTTTIERPSNQPLATPPSLNVPDATPEGASRQLVPLAIAVVVVAAGLASLLLVRRRRKDGDRGKEESPQGHKSGDEPRPYAPSHEPSEEDEDHVIPVGSHSPFKHHCQGHRLGIVVGPSQDKSLRGAMAYLAESSGIQHKLHVPAKSKDARPEISQLSTIDTKVEVYNPKPPKGKKAPPVAPEKRIETYFENEASCCCHWDEVILFAHGGQHELWYFLLNNLPRLLNDRPVKKFVLWVCSTAGEFFPGHQVNADGHLPDSKPAVLGKQPVFEQLAYMLRPKSCHVDDRCGCDRLNCRTLNADGQSDGSCPDGRSSVTLICGAWYRESLEDEGDAVPIAAKLGIGQEIDPKTNKASWKLYSPDGTVRTVHIDAVPAGSDEGNAGAAVTTDKPGNPGNLFGGTGLGTDPGLRGPEPTNLDKIKESDRLKPSVTTKPPVAVDVRYSGGRHCTHDEREGCQRNKTM